jgi:hypothetical protein
MTEAASSNRNASWCVGMWPKLEPAFLYRISAEIERRLGRCSNRRSFTGYLRKSNASWKAEAWGRVDRA